VLRRTPLPELPRPVAPAGLILQATGLGLRAWSMHRLGEFYSRTLRTEGSQHGVIDSGPYRLVRHPGYTGSLLTWTGFALTSRSASVVALVGGLMGRAYHQRITAEEALLRRALPGYVDQRPHEETHPLRLVTRSSQGGVRRTILSRSPNRGEAKYWMT